MDELQPGSVVEGRAGKKYVYMGGDRKSKDSYKEYTPEAAVAKPQEANPALELAGSLVGGINNAASNALKFNPMYHLAQQGSKGMQNMSDLMEQGAYAVGGKVTDVTGSPAAGYTANVATQAVPSILSGSVMKHAADSILKPAGRFLMQSALKPKGDKPAQAVETMLKEGLNVTPGGAKELGGKVSSLSKEVDELIDVAETKGATVNKFDVAKRVQDSMDRFSHQVTPNSDVATIKKALDEFLDNPTIKQAFSYHPNLDEIPVKLAQKLKRGTYSALGSKPYGEVGGASDDVQKALARGLKEELEKAVPGVKGPNEKQGELLNALQEVSRRVDQSGNKNPMGIGFLGENPLAAAGFALDRSELAKSILGRFLYSGAPSILRDTTRLGVGAGMAMTANE